LLATLPAVKPGAEPVYPALSDQQRQLVLRGIGGTQAEVPAASGAAGSHRKVFETLIPMLERESAATLVMRSYRLENVPWFAARPRSSRAPPRAGREHRAISGWLPA
jgi:hypothetical protein